MNVGAAHKLLELEQQTLRSESIAQDLLARIAHLEAAAGPVEKSKQLEHFKSDLLNDLGAIKEALSLDTCVPSNEEIISLKAENAKLHEKVSRLEYRIRHLLKSTE